LSSIKNPSSTGYLNNGTHIKAIGVLAIELTLLVALKDPYPVYFRVLFICP